MYTLEERLLAIKTYYAMGKSYKATLQQLGYPDKTNLYRWLKEYERDHSLHDAYFGLRRPLARTFKATVTAK